MAAMTTRGVKEKETKQIASFIHQAIIHRDDENLLSQLHQKVKEFCKNYPLPN
jgi:glycine hydroxymethyltransferase